MDDKYFGQKLKEIREKSGKTVPEVSEYLTSLGIKAAQKTIYGWEHGHSQPTPNTLLKMCRFYGVEDILGAFGMGYGPTKKTIKEVSSKLTPEEDLAAKMEKLLKSLTPEQAELLCKIAAQFLEHIKNKANF